MVKMRTSARLAASEAGNSSMVYTSPASPAWSSLQGNLPHERPVGQRLTSVHIGSSRVDSTISFPEYNPSPPQRARTAAALYARAPPNMAFDTGSLSGTKKQSWAAVGYNQPELALSQVNWSSSAQPGSAQPRYSPIKNKNHITSSKRELDLFGNRPVSPSRPRPEGGPSVSEWVPSMRLTSDGSFGNDTNARVYKTWVDPKRGNQRQTGQHDNGPVNTAGPRGRVNAVGLNSGRIDTIVPGF